MAADVHQIEAPWRRWSPPIPVPALGGALWLVFFLLVPLVLLVAMSFWRSVPGGMEATWSVTNYEKVVSQPIYLRLLLKTARIAFTTTGLVLAVSYPLAYWIAQGSARRKATCLFLLLVPFWTSYLVRTYAWYPLLGNAGILNTVLLSLGIIREPLEVFLFNELAVHLGLLYVYLPYAAIPIFLSLDRLDRGLLDAAADLGATRGQQFRRITFPLSLPGVLAGSIMVFVLSIGAYVTPQLLGGPSGIMIGNVITELFGAGMNWTLGATLSVLVMAATLIWIWVISRKVRIRQIFMEE